jgi:hypothetical protein
MLFSWAKSNWGITMTSEHRKSLYKTRFPQQEGAVLSGLVRPYGRAPLITDVIGLLQTDGRMLRFEFEEANRNSLDSENNIWLSPAVSVTTIL